MAGAAEEGTRLATDDDLPRLVELARGAVAELAGGRGGAVWARDAARREPFEAQLRDEIADPAHLVLVGTVDEVVMGYAVATVRRVADGGLLGVVTDLFTEAGVRELGVGEVMMDALLAWCREQGCFGVDSLALPGDRHTKNFFESFGLVARAIVVHRALS